MWTLYPVKGEGSTGDEGEVSPSDPKPIPPVTPPTPTEFAYVPNMIVPIPKTLGIPKSAPTPITNAYGIIDSVDSNGANVITTGGNHYITKDKLDNLRKQYPVGSAPWMGPAIMWKVAKMQDLKVSSDGALHNGGIPTFDAMQPELQNLQGYDPGTTVHWTGFRFAGSYLIKIENYLLWQFERNFEGYMTRPTELEEEYNFRYDQPFTPGGVGSVVGIPKGTKAWTLKDGSLKESDYSTPYNLFGLVVEKSSQYAYSRVIVDGHNDYWFLNTQLDVPSMNNGTEITNKYGQILSENGIVRPEGDHAHLSMLKTNGQISPWFTNGSDDKEVYPNVNVPDDAIIFGIYHTMFEQLKKVGFLILYDNKLLYAEMQMPERP